jgi:hypothetical protein
MFMRGKVGMSGELVKGYFPLLSLTSRISQGLFSPLAGPSPHARIPHESPEFTTNRPETASHGFFNHARAGSK